MCVEKVKEGGWVRSIFGKRMVRGGLKIYRFSSKSKVKSISSWFSSSEKNIYIHV